MLMDRSTLATAAITTLVKLRSCRLPCVPSSTKRLKALLPMVAYGLALKSLRG